MKNSSKKEEAIRLRKDMKFSLKKIATILNISKSTTSLWLRGIPLEQMELTKRSSSGGKYSGMIAKNKQPEISESKFYEMIKHEQLTSDRKGRISEAAVSFRLVLLGIKYYVSAFDGDIVDFLIEHPQTGKFLKIQVKSVRPYINGKTGQPFIPIKKYCGYAKRRKYEKNECDFLIGYNYRTDIAYIFSYEELKNISNTVAIRTDAAERWDKILEPATRIELA